MDPEIHFNIDGRCSYYVEDKFNDILQNETTISREQSNHLSFFHLNIRSLQNKIDELSTLLSTLNIKFSVVGITETWLRDSSPGVSIDGYNFVYKNRLARSGGGVGLYVSDNLDYRIRTDICANEDEVMESLFIEIIRPHERNVIVGIIYRPPDQNVNDFVSRMNDVLGEISRDNKTCYLMGDFNLNLLNNENHNATGEFLDGLYSHLFFPLITLPSRITSHTASLIDNIFSNHVEHSYLRSGLLITDISDHLPIFSISSDHIRTHQRQESLFVRDKCEQNISNFLDELNYIDWSNLDGYNDPKICYSKFLERYTKAYEKHFPLKKLKRRPQLRKPWISQGLLKSIKQKNKLYKQYLSNPSSLKQEKYKTYKNKLNHSLRIAKRSYYDKKLNESKSNMRATWRLLNELLNSKKLRPKPNSVFKNDDQEISDPMEIANRFCYYFSNIGPNLAKRIQSATSHKNFLSGDFSQSMFLDLATQEEIVDIVCRFPEGKSAGYDNIPMSTIKRSISSISSPLTHIVNLSIIRGIVPNELKIARVVPIFKSGDKALFSNYRPISVLPCFSKILERIIYNRIINYLNDFNVLCDNQYGFRKNRSPSLALIDLCDRISSAFDRKEHAIGVFLDLSKAFDTVNHAILFDKLEHYGIRGLALEWVKSYFSERTQFVEFNKVRSSPQGISCGVPQGSILGPLFFILYVNDLNNASMLDAILFADDANLFISHNDPVYLMTTLNIELNKLSTWFAANRLSLNLSKTNFMVFKPRQKKQSFEFQVFINDQPISQVSETMFLGVFLDDNLCWKPHISLLASKLSKSIGIIHKSRFFLSTLSLRTLYNSMILPYLNYCNIAWGGTYKSNLQRIVILQKRALRIVNNSTHDANTGPIFKKLKLLKLHDIHSFQLGFFMFSFKNGTLPSKFNNFFLMNSQIHNHNTRNAQSFHLPLCRTNTRQFSIYFQGPKFYNSLNSAITGSSSSASFKIKLKEFLLSLY